jgi:hypothetical protein
MRRLNISKILMSLSACLASAASFLLPVQASSLHSHPVYRSINFKVQWEDDTYVKPVTISGTRKFVLRATRSAVFSNVTDNHASLTNLAVDGTSYSFSYLDYDKLNHLSDTTLVSERYVFAMPFSFSADTSPTSYTLDGNFPFSSDISMESESGITTDGVEQNILYPTWTNIYPTGFKKVNNDGSTSQDTSLSQDHIPEVSDPLVLSPEEYEQVNVTVTDPEYDYSYTETDGDSITKYSMSYVITYSPKYVNVQLKKTWDASVPESERHPVTVHLTRDGQIYPAGNSFTLSADNHWTVTDDSISHLLQYNPETGEPYNYSLIEDGNAYQTSASMTTSGDTVTVELVNAKIPPTPVPAVTDKSPVPNTSAEF